MDSTLRILIVNQPEPAIDWLLHHADQIEIVHSEIPDVVVLHLSPQSKQLFLKQLAQRENSQIIIGALCIDLTTRQVTYEDRIIHLTPTEYRLLHRLACDRGAVVTQEELMAALKSKNSDHLLHVHMSNLRQKIEPNPNQPLYLRTIPSIGYRLVDPA